MKIQLKIFFIALIIQTCEIFSRSKVKNDDLMMIQFHGKSLSDLLLQIAEIKGINILLPSEIEKISINFSTPKEVPMDEIEEYLIYFLSMAGYILTIENGIFVVTKKTDDMVRRASVPLFINVDADELPDNSAYIRVIRFLKHIKVPSQSGAGQDIARIIMDILPDRNNSCMVDSRSNSIIITGPSNTIAAALSIIDIMDNYGIPDSIEIIGLKYTSLSLVSKLLEDLLSVSKETTPQVMQMGSYAGSSYFSPQTKVIQDPKTNSIILMGKKDALLKLRNFIETEIDIIQDSQESVVHVYNLKYLDAKKIAPILQSLVNGQSQQQGSQSVQAAGTAGPFRTFDNVRIIAEENVQSGAVENNQSKLMLGGNRLIIAASKDDYKKICEIIESIDRPQPQVIIEVMILDLEVDKQGQFSSQTRIPALFNLPQGSQMQSVMMDNSSLILTDPNAGNVAISNPSNLTPLSTMGSDLLTPNNTLNGQNQTSPLDQTQQAGGTVGSIVDNTSRNGIIISLGEEFKGKSIAAILNLEQNIAKRNVLANPYTVTQNNVRTEINNTQIRRGQGELSPNNTQYGGATVVKIESYAAKLGIAITPRISYGSRLNLEIDLSIEDFKSNSDDNYDKLTRTLKTSANISSGDLLVLGGLYKQNYSGGSAKTPLLGDIPILGMLFRKNSHAESNSNLVIIIRATIVDEFVLDSFTGGRQSYISGELNELALANMKDPITRVYFKDYNNIKPFKKNQEINQTQNNKKTIFYNEDKIDNKKIENMYSHVRKPKFK